jgi:cytochrome c-type biogenesis protein CcmF
MAGPSRLLNALAIGVGVWLVAAAAAALARRWRAQPGSWARRLRATPLAVWGLVLAHAGLGVVVVGIAADTGWTSEKVLAMSPGQPVALAGRTVTLQSVARVEGPNYEARQAVFAETGPEGGHALVSERRYFPVSGTWTTLAGIRFGLLGNTYVSIGDDDPRGGLVVRMWRHPLVGWIWGGGLIMALGGALSLADRGLRRVRRRAPAARLEPARAGA